MDYRKIANTIAELVADREITAATEVQVPIHDPEAEEQPLIGLSNRGPKPVWYTRGEDGRSFDSGEKFIEFVKAQHGRKSLPYMKQLLQLGQRSGILKPDEAHSLAQSVAKI